MEKEKAQIRGKDGAGWRVTLYQYIKTLLVSPIVCSQFHLWTASERIKFVHSYGEGGIGKFGERFHPNMLCHRL